MSDLASAEQLLKTPPQLPIDWYFDPRIFEAELDLLFRRGPGYVGHEQMVPNPGDYHVLDWMDRGRVLVRGSVGVELLSNVCRHRQAVMLEGRGSVKNIVCPLHRWTYDLDGTLLGAPHFPGNPCLDLGKASLKRWNGLLFCGPRDPAADLAGLGAGADLDFSGYLFDRVEVDQYRGNWKGFMEVYLEDYHVVPFHPGLGSFVDTGDLRWDLGDWYNVQTVGVRGAMDRPGTAAYRRFQEQVLRHDEGRIPRFGAVWFLYYPNVMIEAYPHMLVISTVVPRGVDAFANVVEFYHPEELALFERELVETIQAAYLETAAEDREICNRMQAGREALWRRGDDEFGPYQSPMEDGMVHFHEFLRRELGGRLPG